MIDPHYSVISHNTFQNHVAESTPSEAEYCQQWESFRFPKEFITLEGHRITVLDGGRANGNAGPDYLDAIIMTRDDVRQGAVEVHIEEAGWWQHNHHTDPRFQDVILHVVAGSSERHRSSGFGYSPEYTIMIPVIPNQHFCAPIPNACELITDFSEHHWFLRELGWDRVKQKATRFEIQLKTQSVQSLWYQKTLRCLGYGSNHQAMEKIAQRIPLTLARELSIHLTPAQLFDFILGFLGYGQFYGINTPVWQSIETELGISGYHYSWWKPLRSRPVNHPLFRLYLFFRHIHSWLDCFETGRYRFSDMKNIQSLQVSEPIPSGYDGLFTRDWVSIGKSQVVELLMNCSLPIWLCGTDGPDQTQLRGWANELPAIPVYRKLQKFIAPAVTKSGNAPKILPPLIIQGLLSFEDQWCKNERCPNCVLAHVSPDSK